MNRPVRLLCIPIAVMLMIFLFSSQSYERQSIKEPLSEWLRGSSVSRHLSQMTIHYGTLTIDGRTEGSAAIAEFLLRKLAHLIEYAILGLCLAWAVITLFKTSFSSAALASLLLCTVYAALDEYHQIFVKDRGSRPQDVLLDAAGALIGIAVYAGWKGYKSRRIRKIPPAKRRLP
ncbi:VanZ family protein [Paenibacillus caui]|uniref:VanZ family protein n=1 Tax=Paenibacillus caui TaxID=2873927 RepID=UPI001CA8BAC5|nr:VanZ family protein [Paenibacillus caui]